MPIHFKLAREHLVQTLNPKFDRNRFSIYSEKKGGNYR
jgi:hypothetical protein